MTDAPPEWYVPLPSGYARATRVGVMRDEFGTLGVALPAVLLAEAEAQKQQRRDWTRGLVKMAYSELAHLTASTPEEVRRAVERWAELGKFVDAEFREFDFTARWRDWEVWQPRKQTAIERAEEFLRDALAGGQCRSSAEVERVAGTLGIAPRTLDSARSRLGVEASKEGGEWYVRLPAESQGRKDATEREREVERERETSYSQ